MYGYDFVGASIPKKETRQASTNVVATHFKKLGIPLGKPDPRVAFWKQPIEQIADQLANAINTIPLPPGAPGAPGASSQTISYPTPAKTPPKAAPKSTAPLSADIIAKQKIVADGFTKARQRRTQLLAAKKKSESAQTTVNATAALFKKAGIDINRPNPALPFWKLPAATIQQKVNAAIASVKV